MDYIVTGLTALIGFLVIAAALYLNQEKTTKTSYTPIAQPGKKRKKKSSPKKRQAKKTSTKKSSAKKSSSKKKKKEAAAVVVAAPVETQTTKKKKDNIAGTAKDGTLGLFASSFKGSKGDDDGWETVTAPVKKARSKSGGQTNDGLASEQITVNNLGKLIGKGGETIKNISRESGAKIDTPDRGSGNKVTVSGTAEEVASAIALITEELGEDLSSAPKPAFSAKITVNNVGKLIGRGGETIRRLSEEGARIDTPRDRKATGNVVNVSGPTQEIVDNCIAAIKETIGDDDATPQVFETIAIKSNQRALIIGRGGETINKIKSDSGVNRIDLDKGTGDCKVGGSAAAVKAAMKAIRAILKKDADTVSDVMDCDSNRFGLVIGRGGETIRDISQKFDVKIDTDKANNQIKIRGSKTGVAKAIAQYTKLLAEQKEAGPFGPLADGVKSEIIQVADNLKGRVIGAGGATIKRLQSESGAKIDFGRRGAVDAGCRLSGTDEQIAEAKKLIEDIKAKAVAQDEKAEAARATAAEDAETGEAESLAKESEFVSMAEDATGTGW